MGNETQINHTEQEQRFMKARVKLLLKARFFGQLAMTMKMIPTPSVPVMAVDGKRLFFNPEGIAPYSDPEIRFIIAHEVLHVALLHHVRGKNLQNAELRNMAADYVVNQALVDNPIPEASTPEDALLDHRFRGMSMEQVYRILEQELMPGGGNDQTPDNQGQGQNQDNQGQGQGQGKNQDNQGQGQGQNQDNQGQKFNDFGQFIEPRNSDGSPMSEAQVRAEVAQVKGKVMNAVTQAKKAGTMPGGIERLISELYAPKADWATLLQQYVSEICFEDWNFQACHTRLLQQYGIVCPVIDGRKLGDMTAIVDTSKSTNKKQLKQMGGEISSILFNYPGTRVFVIYCDASVQKVEEFDSSEGFRVAGKGGGGTAVRPALRWIDEHLPDNKLTIYLTDGYVPDISALDERDEPVIVGVFNGKKDLGLNRCLVLDIN